ncbi:MAG TPA: GNAT family N-acetyltransferase [Rhodanobacteraceae bacterium]|nr:GNAT family N-acetyltransferase [Rhodanobacteraceae bacterium]
MSTTQTSRHDYGYSSPMDISPLPPRSAQRFADAGVHEPTRERGEQVQARDGRTLWLRSIAPDDVDAIRRCFTRLSSDEIRMRFLYHMRELPEPMAQRLCRIDATCEAAFVLEDDAVEPAEIRGVGRIYIDATSNRAEFAVLVEKAWAGRGLGALLMQRLVDECRRRDIDELWGYVMIENRPMLDLCRALGFRRRSLTGDPGVSVIALTLD